MNHPARHDVLKALGEMSEAFPDWRFGQMIANMAVVARGATEGAIWDLEDEELLQAIQGQLEKRRVHATS